ncbi:MAG: type II toxin-antitoxin system HicB family antitoxin [Sphingobacterium sp.]|nr:type II toxin-antitoxin system HicB family antitoxin [Sphingobacterium sp.]
MCRRSGRPLFKSYNGTFNIRMPAELHRKAARKSALLGISLNQLVQRAVEREVHKMRRRSYAPREVQLRDGSDRHFLAAACTGQEAVLVGNSINAAGAAVNPPIMRAVDGIEGWKRTGPPDRYTKDGLYGYIDGGAEIVLSARLP